MYKPTKLANQIKVTRMGNQYNPSDDGWLTTSRNGVLVTPSRKTKVSEKFKEVFLWKS